MSRLRSLELLTYVVLISACSASILFAQPTTPRIGHGDRCGFLVGPERDRVAKLGEGLQADADRPTLNDAEFIESADGRFRIHFTRSGTDGVPPTDLNVNGIPDFVETALRALDSGFVAAMDHGGSIALPDDGMEGGSPALDVYLRDLSKAGPQGLGFYGITMPDSLVKDRPEEHWPRFTCWMEVDNDFAESDLNLQGNQTFNTFGEDALRVTCAHEYHHVVQLGGYGDANVQLMIYEFMSTWMEMLVYPDIHDWINYTSRFFLYPEAYPLSDPSSFNGYVWGWFIGAYNPASSSQELVTTLLEKIGEGMRPFPSLVRASEICGAPLDVVFVQTLPTIEKTGYDAGPNGELNHVIPSAHLLPPITYTTDEQVFPPSAMSSGALRPFEVRAFRYAIPSSEGGPPVSVSILVTWPDTAAFNNSVNVVPKQFSIALSTPPAADAVPINGTTWGVRVTPAEIAYHIEGEILRYTQAPYPNPVVLSTSRDVFIPVVGAVQGDEAEVTLMSVQTIGIDRRMATVEIDGDRVAVRFTLPDDLTPGTYLLEVDHQGTRSLHKIAVKRQ